MKFPTIIALLLSLSGAGFSAMSLLAKTRFESVFLTSEQLLKRRFLIIASAVLYCTIVVPLIYVQWDMWGMDKSYSSIKETAILIAFYTFFISSTFLIFYLSTLLNFIVKEKSLYKVSIEDLGELYIIKMKDIEICICSSDAHANLEAGNSQLYFVKLDDMMKLPFTKETVALPPRSFWQKLFG